MQIPSPLGCCILFSSTITALFFWPRTEAKTAATKKEEYIGEAHRGPVRLEEWEAKSRGGCIFQESPTIACRIYQHEYFVCTRRKHLLSSQGSLFSFPAFSNSQIGITRGITRDISLVRRFYPTAHSYDYTKVLHIVKVLLKTEQHQISQGMLTDTF